jgi:hypothetical protein
MKAVKTYDGMDYEGCCENLRLNSHDPMNDEMTELIMLQLTPYTCINVVYDRASCR